MLISSWVYLDGLLLDDKVDYGLMLLPKHFDPHFTELLFKLIRPHLFIAIWFFILHEHCCNGHIEYEKSTDPNTSDKEEANKCRAEDVLVHRHYLGPAILSCANEDGQKGGNDVIELSDAKVERAEVCVDPEVWVRKHVLAAIGVVGFESWAAERTRGALVMIFAT